MGKAENIRVNHIFLKEINVESKKKPTNDKISNSYQEPLFV